MTVLSLDLASLEKLDMILYVINIQGNFYVIFFSLNVIKYQSILCIPAKKCVLNLSMDVNFGTIWTVTIYLHYMEMSPVFM